MVTKTAKTGVSKVMVDPSPMHTPEEYTAKKVHHEDIDGDLVKLTEMVNACLGSKLVEPLTVVDMTCLVNAVSEQYACGHYTGIYLSSVESHL